jgi:hypothetical protein
MTSAGPSSATVKRLFALSGNRCAMPGCQLTLVDPESGKVTGRVCHIRARRPGGPRYDPNQTDDERSAFDNLVLMCPIHHDVIDTEVGKYPITRLLELKARAEKASEALQSISDAQARALVEGNSGSFLASFGQTGGQIAHTIHNYAAGQVAPAGDARYLRILLQKVEAFWIDGVLANSVHEAARVQLQKDAVPELVLHPWEMVLEDSQRRRTTIPQDWPIADVFRRQGGTMLIVGEPGSGKTVTLLELARDLITAARVDPSKPIPVILNLSSWAVERRRLGDWLVAELSNLYRVSRSISERWIRDDNLLLLLDGLDEVAATHRSACVDAINEFLDTHGLTQICICCRTAEYEELRHVGMRLQLQGAVAIQPLRDAQIFAYIDRTPAGSGQLAGLIRENQAMHDLSRTPLMLSIMVLAYGSSLDNEAALTERNDQGYAFQLFQTYIDRMFKRARASDTAFSREKTVYWLHVLARKMLQREQSVFFLDQIQPTWLPGANERHVYETLARLVPGLVVALPAGVTWTWACTGLMGWNPAATFFLVVATHLISVALATSGAFGITGGTIVGLSYALTGFLPSFTAIGLGAAVGVGAFAAVASFLCFTVGLGRIWRARHADESRAFTAIATVDKLQWSSQKAVRGLSSNAVAVGLAALIVVGIAAGSATSVLVGVIAGAVFGISMWITVGVLMGLGVGLIEEKSWPNQGVWQSARSAVITGAVCALSAGAPVGIVIGLAREPLDGLNAGLALATFTGVGGGLFFGGSSFIRHFILRVLVWKRGDAPLDYVAFLNFAAKRILLVRVGGGFIWVHRLLLEHFASLKFDDPDGHASCSLGLALDTHKALGEDFDVSVYVGTKHVACTRRPCRGADPPRTQPVRNRALDHCNSYGPASLVQTSLSDILAVNRASRATLTSQMWPALKSVVVVVLKRQVDRQMAKSLCLSDKWSLCVIFSRLTLEGREKMVSAYKRSLRRGWRAHRRKVSVDDFSLGWQLNAVQNAQWRHLTPEAWVLYGRSVSRLKRQGGYAA